MTWILSILGIGGIAAALVFIPGALPAAIGALSALLSLIRRNPWPCAVVALLALSAWLWTGKRSETRRADAWALAHKAQKAAYRAAQAAAKAKQAAQDAANIRGQIDQNRSLNRAYDQLESASRDAVARYIATHRLRGQAVGSQAGRANPAGVHPDPGQAPASPAPTDLVAIRTDELEQLAAKAVRDTEHTQFLGGLIEQGLAVPERLVLPEVRFGTNANPGR